MKIRPKTKRNVRVPWATSIVFLLAAVSLLLGFQNCNSGNATANTLSAEVIPSAIENAGDDAAAGSINTSGSASNSESSSTSGGSGNGDVYAGFMPGTFLNIQPENSSMLKVVSGIEATGNSYVLIDGKSGQKTNLDPADLLINGAGTSIMYGQNLFTVYPAVPDVLSSYQESFCIVLVDVVAPGADLSVVNLMMTVTYFADGHRSAFIQVPLSLLSDPNPQAPLQTEIDVSESFQFPTATYIGNVDANSAGGAASVQMQINTTDLRVNDAGYLGQITYKSSGGLVVQSPAICQFNQATVAQ